MEDYRLKNDMTNNRSIGKNLGESNFSSMTDTNQSSCGVPFSTLTTSNSNFQQRNKIPPPLPSRKPPQPSNRNYSAPLCGNYNYNAYNSYNPYGTNSFYNAYPAFPRNGVYAYFGNNSFSQQAEMSTREAFGSIESIVRTVNSIAMMLDSTYQAVLNSFRALLGVSDQMTQLKSHFHNILSSIAVLRVIKFLFRRLKYLVTLMRKGSQAATEEFLWAQSLETTEAHSINKNTKNNTKTWPVMVFFVVVMTGPWLLWKLLSSFTQQKIDEQHKWSRGVTAHYVAQAEHSFEGRQEDELSFQKACRLIIAPEEFQATAPKDWLLASCDGLKIGFIPRNYIKIISKQQPPECTDVSLNYTPLLHVTQAPCSTSGKLQASSTGQCTKAEDRSDLSAFGSCMAPVHSVTAGDTRSNVEGPHGGP